MIGITLCLSCVLCCIQVSAWSPTARLQRGVIPKSYSLSIAPNIDKKTYKGEVTILIHTDHSLNNITLNIKRLKIQEVTLDQAIGRTNHQINTTAEFIHVSYSDQSYIDPGEHVLNIKFEGSLFPHMNGFYSLRFRPILATSFSSIHARAAFPCFDEPYFKSIFSIRLVKPNYNWIALSNMKEIGSFNTSNGIAVDFQSTFPISTYLLTWILTDCYTYDEIQYRSQNRMVSLRFFTRGTRTRQRKQYLRLTEQILQFYENYTAIYFPLQKLDSIEIPFYLNLGMEHWGMIVYRDGAVTSDADTNPSLNHFLNAALLIAHEVAHMWFGNLDIRIEYILLKWLITVIVTHEWFNDLWLTEGFARFMEFKAVSSIMQEPFVKSMFQIREITNLYDIQCGEESTYATATAQFPRDSDAIHLNFMETTYDQGAAILTMLENVMGPEKFQDAVRSHLQKHQFSTATTGDFINTIQSAIPDTNVRGFLETYLFQKKFPIVNVNENTETYILQQEPVCGKENTIFENKWSIPITYITSSNSTPRLLWFDKDMNRLLIPKQPNDRWIKINYLGNDLYRTNYTSSLLNALQEDFSKLNPSDRGSLLQDTFLLAAFRNLSCRTPILLMSHIRNSSGVDSVTLEYTLKAFDLFKGTMDKKPDVHILLDSFEYHVLISLKQKLGWTVKPQETLSQRLLRSDVMSRICRGIDYKLCTKDVEEIRMNNLTIHPDIAHIYKDIEEQMQLDLSRVATDMKVSSNINRTVDKRTLMSTPKVKNNLGEEGDECSIWIRENLPKMIEDMIDI